MSEVFAHGAANHMASEPAGVNWASIIQPVMLVALAVFVGVVWYKKRSNGEEVSRIIKGSAVLTAILFIVWIVGLIF